MILILFYQFAECLRSNSLATLSGVGYCPCFSYAKPLCCPIKQLAVNLNEGLLGFLNTAWLLRAIALTYYFLLALQVNLHSCALSAPQPLTRAVTSVSSPS